MLLKQITVVKVQKQKHIIHISKCLENIINNSKYFKLKSKIYNNEHNLHRRQCLSPLMT